MWCVFVLFSISLVKNNVQNGRNYNDKFKHLVGGPYILTIKTFAVRLSLIPDKNKSHRDERLNKDEAI